MKAPTYIQISVEQYPVIVSDEKPSNGNWAIYNSGEIIKYDVELNTDNLKKVIAQSKPIHEGLPLFTPVGGDSEIKDTLLDFGFWLNSNVLIDDAIDDEEVNQYLISKTYEVELEMEGYIPISGYVNSIQPKITDNRITIINHKEVQL